MASKEYEMAVKIAGEIERSFYNSTKLTKKELKNIASTASQTSSSISASFKKGMTETSGIFNGIEKAGKAAFKAIATTATVAATAATAVLSASVSVGSAFEKQMSTVQSISGAAGSSLEELKDKAKEMGATTSFSATEAGEAMEYMAMAGWKTEDMISGIDGIMNLAAASGEELSTTSDIVTDALTAFGLTASDTNHFVDVLAKTSSNANTNVSLMGETFQYMAPVAGALGYSVDDCAVAIGLMANSGIKATNAGTALRGLLTNLAKPTASAQKAMDKLGISLTDSNGEMKDFSELQGDLREAFAGLTEAQKAQYAASLAGKTGMSGLLAIVNASESDVNKLTDSITNCTGAAQEMADTRLDNLDGDITILKSGLEGLGIQVYEGLNAPLREAAQFATKVVSGISGELSKTGEIGNIIEMLQRKLPTTIRETKEFAESIVEFADPLIKVGEWLWEHPDVIVSTIAGIGTALVTYKVVSGVMSLASAFAALSPAGAIILGIGAAVTAISGIATYIKLTDKKMKEQNLAEHFGDISLSLEDLNEIAGYIVSNDNLESVQESLAAMDKCEEISNDIDDLTNSFNKANWKVSIGMELSDEEKESYKEDITSYISDVQDLVTQNQYAVNLSVGTLINDDGIENSNVVDKINAFYADKESELESLGTKLNKTVTDAFQDGLLDVDEVKEITELQKQMADIQSAVAGSNFDAQLELLDTKYDGGELDADSFKNLQSDLNDQVQSAVSDYDESFTLSVSNAKLMLDDGAIDQSEYDDMVKQLKEGYLDQVGDIELKANSFQMDTITQQYADAKSAISDLEKTTDKALSDTTEYLENGFGNVQLSWDEMFKNIQNYDGLDKDTKAALSDLYEEMQPSVEQMTELKNKYEESGMEVPQAISDGLKNAAVIGALVGDTESIWNYVGQVASGSTEYSTAIQKAEEAGKYVPGAVSQGIADAGEKSSIASSTSGVWDYVSQASTSSSQSAIETARANGSNVSAAVGQGITANKTSVNSSVSQLFNQVTSQLKASFAGGVAVDIPIKYATNVLNSDSSSTNAAKLPGHATGGIFNVPHIAWFAEDGPEAAIPLDGSKNAVDLWTQTGQLLGMGNTTGEDFTTLSTDLNKTTNESIQPDINYNPTFVFYGDSPSKEDLVSGSSISEENFEKFLANYIKRNGRLSFSK